MAAAILISQHDGNLVFAGLCHVRLFVRIIHEKVYVYSFVCLR